MAVWIVREGKGGVQSATALEQDVEGIGWAEFGDLWLATSRGQMGHGFATMTACRMTSAQNSLSSASGLSFWWNSRV